MKQQQEIDEIWRELRFTLRRLSEIYGIHYSTMFTAVKQAVENVLTQHSK